MSIFNALGEGLNYDDIIQFDGAFAVSHNNYHKTPKFNDIETKDIAQNSRINSFSNKEKIEDIEEIISAINTFDGTEKDFSLKDREELWRLYFLEYVNAFSKLTNVLPKSVVTVYTGRQAIEIGLKYILLIKTKRVEKSHDLGVLSNLLFEEYEIKDDYMDCVNTFCESFCRYIEGGNPEYFRYPEYKKNSYFAGNRLDIGWISYNFALILLKLIHFVELDDEIC